MPPLLVMLSLAKFCRQDTPAAITDWVRHRHALWHEKLALYVAAHALRLHVAAVAGTNDWTKK